jgi:coenzyme F420-0:L-glutamate ligase/coenzyme F420-1:gamma-L-glutamate ligase
MPIINVGQSLDHTILASLRDEGLALQSGDVVAVASKVVSTCEGQLVNLQNVRVSDEARRLANKWSIDEHLTAIVLSEADKVLGGVKGFLLTLKKGIMTANAGVDLKNAPLGTAILWPKRPDISARRLRQALGRHYRSDICVEIVDSRVTPLRLGTVGLAIGLAGFVPVRDDRGERDLYGRKIRVTQTNVADDLAASAHFLMGEATERVGAVVIRNAHLALSDAGSSRDAKISLRKCLIGNSLDNVGS